MQNQNGFTVLCFIGCKMALDNPQVLQLPLVPYLYNHIVCMDNKKTAPFPEAVLVG